MEAGITLRERLWRLCGRIGLYFRSVIDRDLSWPVRVAYLVKAMAASAAIGAVLLFAYALLLIPFTPSISDLRKAKAESPSILMSEDGKELAVFKRMNREWVELDQISPYVVKALIATEDHRFYEHHGVDLKRTAAGILRTLQGDPEGGSTLTQQLARNLYPEEIGRKRTISRKIKELITALKIEYAYSKQEILLTYLNTMPFLYNAFGIEMGARTYFDKPAAKLNALESATLVGMLKGTSYYNPVLNPERALKRRNVVLSQMAKRGVLSAADFNALKRRPLRLDFERQPEPFGSAPHLAEHVRKWLVDWADRNDFNLYSDGLVIYTTIDSRMQAIATKAVEQRLDALQAVADVEWGLGSERLISSSPYAYVGMRRRVQPFGYLWKSRGALLDAFVRESAAYRSAVEAGAAPDEALAQLKRNGEFMDRMRAEKTRLETGFVAMDPTNGHVKAWVGSRDFAVDRFDHVAQARRQPGSTFKPFVYGAALEDGMSPERRFTDAAVDIPMGNGSVWQPTDVSAPSGREMTIRDGLAFSKNTITAQVMQEVGPKKAAAFARKLGVNQSKLDMVPALALGTSPVTLLEMISAYSTIASGGEFRKPVLVSRIVDRNGAVLESFASDGERVISGQVAYGLTSMLREVINQGTGRGIRSQFGIHADVAGKTGTTQNNTDGWFILMHPRLVAGSWVGFNDARVAMRSNYWGQGAQTALPLVGEFYRRSLQARLIDPGVKFTSPPQSFFGTIMDKVYQWFGWGQAQPAPKPQAIRAQPAPPRPVVPHEAPVAPPDASDEMERIIIQANEANHTYENETAVPVMPDQPPMPMDYGRMEPVPGTTGYQNEGPGMLER